MSKLLNNILGFKSWMAISEVSLNWSQFEKRLESNLIKFYKKIKNKEPFKTEDGKEIYLIGIAIKEKTLKKKRRPKPIVYRANMLSQNSWVEMISNFIRNPGFDIGKNLMVVIDDGNVTPTLKPFGILSKTAEFGSKGSSMKKTEISDSTWGLLKSLPNFKPLIPGKSIELGWISKFNKELAEILIDNKLEACDVDIGGVILKDVVGVMGAPGAEKDPKADIVFVDKNKKLIGYTSLKDGKTAANFQQWSGLSKIKDEEINRFLSNLKKYLKTIGSEGVPEKTTVYSEIASVELKNKVAWGLKYAPTKFGIENVEFIMQGDPSVTFSNGIASLKVAHLITRHSSDIISPTSNYRPVFVALFRNDRSDFGINKTRIFAYAYGGRKMNIRLDDNGFTKLNGSKQITPYKE